MLGNETDASAFDILPTGFYKVNTMNDDQLLKRIILRPKVMAGKPVIRGTRLTVDHILNLLAHGETEQEILNPSSPLEPDFW